MLSKPTSIPRLRSGLVVAANDVNCSEIGKPAAIASAVLLWSPIASGALRFKASYLAKTSLWPRVIALSSSVEVMLSTMPLVFGLAGRPALAS